MFVAIIAGQRGAVHDRNINHRSGTRDDAKEFGRGNARNRERNVVDVTVWPMAAGFSSEPVAPIAVTQDGHLRRPRTVIAIGNEAAQGRNNSKAAKETAGDELNGPRFGLATDDQIEPSGVFECEKGGEDVVVAAKQFVSRPWQIRTCYPASRLVVHIAVAALDHDGKLFRAPVQDRQLSRIPDRQGANHNRVHDAVYGGIRADAERER